MSSCFFRPVDSPAGSLQSTVDAMLGVPPLLQLLMLHNTADGFNGHPALIKSKHDLWSPTVFDGRLCSPLGDARPTPTVTPVEKQATKPVLGTAPAMENHSNTPPPQADKTEAE